MCTVSWLRDDEGYQVLFNRDEKKTRRPGLPPQVHERDGVRYLAPLDRDFGGSWVATNEYGVTVCLLNGKAVNGKAVRSRGQLVVDSASLTSAPQVAARVGATALGEFAPFTLATLDTGGTTIVLEWDGRGLLHHENADQRSPLISSSFEPELVRDERHRLLRQMSAGGRLDTSVLFAFHQSHGPAPGPYSPCMHRDDAETVSFCWVTVNAREVRQFYAPGSPCQWRPGGSQQLRRAA